MWSAFSDLTPEDVVVIIGTSGVVLPVTEMARQFDGYKILNNLAPEPSIDDSAFDKTFYQPATKAVAEIDRILEERFEGKLGVER
jgi:NAD-dependent deacetylase